MMVERNKKRDFLFALFVSSMVIVNTLGTKITTIASVRVSVGIFLVPVLFLITDIVGDVYGDREAQHFVNIASLMLVFLFLMINLCISLVPNETWGLQAQYSAVFGQSLRMTLASLISFVISQKLDVAVFGVLKRLTKEKHLWIRNNVSTIISQFVDTALFEFIAFYKMAPGYDFRFIFSLILPYWIFKICFALLDTPFCYLGVKWLRGKEEADR